MPWLTDGAIVRTVPVGTDWHDFENSDPITDVEQTQTRWRLDLGYAPPVLVVTQAEHAVLWDHPLVKDRLKLTGATEPNVELMGQLFDVTYRVWRD